MKLDYYRARPERAKSTAPHQSIPPAVIETIAPLTGSWEASSYVPHPDLVSAVNVALVLGRPLLVTGEPGTGKTKLANSIAWQLGYAGPFKFVAKSTSVARDLFYTYDALGRFYAAETAKHAEIGGTAPQRDAGKPLAFIDYAPLGGAILLAHRSGDVSNFVDPKKGARIDHPGEASRSVVVIDEVDKAPRDFPNDLLDELDTMQFRMPELNDATTPELTNRSMRPVVIITSNRERQLPDAFLRRCVYFEIPFPKRWQDASAGEKAGAYTIEDIIASRYRDVTREVIAKSPLYSDALSYFYQLRTLGEPLQKPPATAELIDWLDALRRIEARPEVPLGKQPDTGRDTLFTLLKGSADLKRGQALYESLYGGGGDKTRPIAS